MMMHVGLEPDYRVDARKGVFSHTVGRQPWYNPDTKRTGTNDNIVIPFIYKLLGADRCFVLVTQEVPLCLSADDAYYALLNSGRLLSIKYPQSTICSLVFLIVLIVLYYTCSILLNNRNNRMIQWRLIFKKDCMWSTNSVIKI